jgi:hypothetical protein
MTRKTLLHPFKARGAEKVANEKAGIRSKENKKFFKSYPKCLKELIF